MKTSPRLSGARTHTRSLAALVTGIALATTLAACGDDDGGDTTANDPAASSSSPSPDESSETPTETPTEESPEPDSDSASGASISATGSVGVTEAVVLSGTEVGGSVSEMAFALDTDQAKADFASQFEPAFADVVTQTATEQQAPGATTYAATVAIGCEGPRSVAIDAGEAGFQVLPKIPKTNKECLAPMTYVVVFAAPDA
ncbi:hypothetical protein J2X46_001306 [Nocardioides sp. BE266]|uniref:hypothetical protein n=1 Tax=Nocardioides sp. BE266 TaxID=2817725 RepID=UPI0028661475|nr:hypothetical protein [Nocardioides sp. BE266]MDR7252330.1 hypothetical protein [Nocardioides sp. BE266]